MAIFSQDDIISSLENIGSKTASPEKFGTVASLFWTPMAVEIADLATAKLKATYDTLLKQTSNRCYQFPIVRQGESLNEEDVFFEYTASGGSFKTKDGRLKMDTMFHVPYQVVKSMMTFDGIEGRIFVQTTNNYAIGASEDGTKFIGLRVRLFVSSPNWDFEGTPGMVTVRVEFLDSKPDYWEYTEYVKPTAFNFQELDSLTPLLIDVSGASATAATLTVTNTYNAGIITGLLDADFTLTGTGTKTSVTGNGDGTYTAVTVGQVNGDIWSLVAPASISIDGYYVTASGTGVVAGI